MLIIIIILTLTREEGMVNIKNGAANKWRIKPTPTPSPANRSFDSEQKMLGNICRSLMQQIMQFLFH